MQVDTSEQHVTGQRRLVVIVPSISDLTKPWEKLVAQLKSLPGYDDGSCRWEYVHHGAGQWSRKGAAYYARNVGAEIHKLWVANGGYDSVVLVGHSFGGICVRHAFVSALGAFDQQDRRDWASRVERVVLFASINRGIEVSFRRALWLPVVAWLGRQLPTTRHWLAYDVLSGSTFIANLRIAWIRKINGLPRPPVMVQFLGTSDGLVTADDSRDVDTFRTGSQEFVPGATHSNLIRLDQTDDPDGRLALISSAFTKPWPDSVQQVGDPDQDVVIILHGIRASNDVWPRRMEEHIEEAWPGSEAIAATYGRFSARKFMLPPTRRKFLPWMQDMYAERLAANPRARFHFIGHSNGTYLLGESLRLIPAMKFNRILLLGSVLPTTYEWGDRFSREQVQYLRNDRAAWDVPVGLLCAALRGLAMPDVGTAGVEGFRWEDPRKREVYYYKGGHGKALESDENRALLAQYVMDGQDAAPQRATLSDDVSPVFRFASSAAPWLSRLAAVALVVGGVAFAVYGPWGLCLNIAALIGGLFIVFVILDII